MKRLDSNRALFTIVGFGVMLRIAALSLVGGRPLHNEAPGYHQMALQLLHHEKFDPYWPPGVPYFLWFFHALFGEGILVARAAILPVYVGFSLCLYALLKEVSTRRAGNLAVLAFALYPPYVRYSFNPSTEYPAAACLMAIVYFGILSIRKPSSPISVALGFFLGALALIRPSCLPLVIFFAVYAYLRTKRLSAALVPLVVSTLLVSVWVLKAHSITGRFVMINESNWQNFFLGNNPYTPLYRTWPEGQAEVGFPSGLTEMVQAIESKPPAARDRLYEAVSLKYIVSRPDLFLLRTLNRMRAYYGFPIHHAEPLAGYFHLNRGRELIALELTIVDVCFYWPIMVLAIVFLFSFKGSLLETDYAVMILGAGVIYAVPYWVSFSQPRFNFPVVPLFAVFAAMFVDSLLEKPQLNIFQPIILSVGRKRAMLLVLALFFYAQIEWAAVAYLGI